MAREIKKVQLTISLLDSGEVQFVEKTLTKDTDLNLTDVQTMKSNLPKETEMPDEEKKRYVLSLVQSFLNDNSNLDQYIDDETKE